MGDVFHLRLLGPVEVEREGEPVRGFESRKALALLGYLAVQDHPVSRSHLANLFWSDKPEPRGRANLSWVLHKISTLLPGYLQADRYTIRLHRSATYWLDVDEFRQRVNEATRHRGHEAPRQGGHSLTPELVASLTEAVRLYRGDFMEGLYLDGCPEFELWLVGEQQRWRQRVVQVLHTLIAHHTARGVYAAAMDYNDPFAGPGALAGGSPPADDAAAGPHRAAQ